MTYYRVDKRVFAVGDTIPPTPKENPITKTEEVEGLLESNRPPNKPSRFTILKIFNNESIAKIFWVTCSNSIIYEVEINESEILHIGDYNLIEQITKESDTNQKKILSIKYWKGIDLYDKVTKEIFVANAKVLKILGREAERRQEQCKRYGINFNNLKMKPE